MAVFVVCTVICNGCMHLAVLVVCLGCIGCLVQHRLCVRLVVSVMCTIGCMSWLYWLCPQWSMMAGIELLPILAYDVGWGHRCG